MIKDIKKEAAKKTVELLPKIYDDLLSPMAKVIGEELANTAKTILAPVTIPNKILSNHIESILKKCISGKKEEDLVVPKRNILIGVLQGINHNFDQEEIRELFETLLERSIDRNTSSLIQPKFLEILKQISKDEAVLLKYYSNNAHFIPSIVKINVYADDLRINPTHGEIVSRTRNLLFKDFFKGLLLEKLEFPENYTMYIENLENLSIIERVDKIGDNYQHLTYKNGINFLIDNELVKNIFRNHKKKYEELSDKNWKYSTSLSIDNGYFQFTKLGTAFCLTCIENTDEEYKFIYRDSSDFAIEKAFFKKGNYKIGERRD